MNCLALCPAGLEKVLGNELKKLGYAPEPAGPGRLRFATDMRGVYRALLSLRTADRLLLELARARADGFGPLFDAIVAVPWEDYLPRSVRLKVAKVHVHASPMSSVPTAQSVVQKAVYTRLMSAHRLRSMPEDGEEIQLRLSLDGPEASLGIDLSGASLSRRGYRKRAVEAPLKETVAAAMLLFSGWRRKFPLRDPFCGSGTIPIEAALYAFDIAPGSRREDAIRALPFHDEALMARVVEEAKAKVDMERPCSLSGSDLDPMAVEIAKENASRAGLEGKIAFSRLAMEKLSLGPGPGLIVANPPYGERMGDRESARRLYGAMKGLLDRNPGWAMTVVSDTPAFDADLGVKADKVRKFSNGAIDSYFFCFGSLS
jgi:putative N6-adenine-specific DNA methylase